MIREEGSALVVSPAAGGRWSVSDEGTGHVSEHGTAGEALAAARLRARTGGEPVVMRDLYGRTHVVGGARRFTPRRPALN